MRFFRNVFSQLHTFVLWALFSVLFWGWIFALITDTSPAKKIAVYCDVPELRDVDLAVELERHMPEGIRMVKVHSFDYVMMDIENIGKGDIFIVAASDLEKYAEFLTGPDGEGGVKIYDAATGTGAAAEYIGYTDEDFYLFLGSGSVHLEDGKAAQVAGQLLSMTGDAPGD